MKISDQIRTSGKRQAADSPAMKKVRDAVQKAVHAYETSSNSFIDKLQETIDKLEEELFVVSKDVAGTRRQVDRMLLDVHKAVRKGEDVFDFMAKSVWKTAGGSEPPSY